MKKRMSLRTRINMLKLLRGRGKERWLRKFKKKGDKVEKRRRKKGID